jgi:hypothetical protein
MFEEDFVFLTTLVNEDEDADAAALINGPGLFINHLLAESLMPWFP